MRWTLQLSNSETQECGNSETQNSKLNTQKFGSSDALCPDSASGRSVPPFEFDTVEMSSNLTEDMSFSLRVSESRSLGVLKSGVGPATGDRWLLARCSVTRDSLLLRDRNYLVSK